MNGNNAIRVRRLNDIMHIRRLVPEWHDLWLRCPAATTFQRPEWLLSWIEIFQPAEPVFIEVRSGDRLVGIAALLIYTRNSERVLAFMGGGVSDYLDVLIDPVFTRAALMGIHEFVATEIAVWDIAEFTDLGDGSPLLHAWPDSTCVSCHDTCPVLKLPSNVEDLKTAVPPHKLRNLRNARRRVERGGGGLLQLADTSTLDHLLEVMMTLHEKRWSESSRIGMLADERVRAFHRRVAPLLLKRRVLRLYGLRFGDRYIAAIQTFFEGSVAYCYLQGYDPEFRGLSPGTQILGSVIEEAVGSGIGKINFLRGREAYKYAWGAQDEATFCVTTSRRAVRAPAIDITYAA